MIKIYPIVPVSAPRQVRKDAWDPSAHVQRYRAFRDEVRIRGVQLPRPFHHVIFVMPMPQSWSQNKKRAHDGMPHECKPDRDNLEKALLDSVYGEDSHVWDGRCTKLWGYEGLIIVSDVSMRMDLPWNLDLFNCLGKSVA